MLTMLNPSTRQAQAVRCLGAQDTDGSPICDGPDVRRVRVRVQLGRPQDVFEFVTDWCADCRADALAGGAMRIAETRILDVDETILERQRESLSTDAEAEFVEFGEVLMVDNHDGHDGRSA